MYVLCLIFGEYLYVPQRVCPRMYILRLCPLNDFWTPPHKKLCKMEFCLILVKKKQSVLKNQYKMGIFLIQVIKNKVFQKNPYVIEKQFCTLLKRGGGGSPTTILGQSYSYLSYLKNYRIEIWNLSLLLQNPYESFCGVTTRCLPRCAFSSRDTQHHL